MANVVPATSVEFQTLTTESAYGDVSEVDFNLYTNDKGEETADPQYWKLLAFYTRDIRLGYLNPKIHDIPYYEDMLGLSHALLNAREGKFQKQSLIALNRVASALELSNSINGFFRKNAQSIHQTGESVVTETKSGGFNPLKRRGGGY